MSGQPPLLLLLGAAGDQAEAAQRVHRDADADAGPDRRRSPRAPAGRPRRAGRRRRTPRGRAGRAAPAWPSMRKTSRGKVSVGLGLGDPRARAPWSARSRTRWIRSVASSVGRTRDAGMVGSFALWALGPHYAAAWPSCHCVTRLWAGDVVTTRLRRRCLVHMPLLGSENVADPRRSRQVAGAQVHAGRDHPRVRGPDRDRRGARPGAAGAAARERRGQLAPHRAAARGLRGAGRVRAVQRRVHVGGSLDWAPRRSLRRSSAAGLSASRTWTCW